MCLLPEDTSRVKEADFEDILQDLKQELGYG
jgi:hypothetical protein